MKYEYRVEIISKFDNTRSDNTKFDICHKIDILNNLGKEGWELVSSSTMGEVIYGYFKRVIKS